MSTGTRNTEWEAWHFEEDLASAANLISSDPAAALERALILADRAQDPRAFRLAAEAHRKLGQDEEAANAELAAIRCGLAPLLQQAVQARQAGKADQSKALAERFLRIYPGDLLARTIAAEALMAMRQYVDAERILGTVVDRAPAFPRASVLLARCMAEQLRIRDAAAEVGRLLNRVPNDEAALRYLADLRSQAGDYAGACELYEQVLLAAPDDAGVQLKYAQNLRVSGNRPQSVAVLRRLIDKDPHNGAAWWALAYYFPEALEDSDLERIRSALSTDPLSRDDEVLLKVALSVIHDRRGEREEAFRQLSEVKQSRARDLPYSAQAMSSEVDRLIAEFTPELFAARESQGDPDSSPIFIVGIPRSGSTLTERILGRHSKIEGAGELQVMPHLVAALEEHRRVAGGQGGRAALPADLSRMAHWYLERAGEFRHTGKPRFVDKYNSNWLHAGLIRLMLPNARIIDVRRDALDCCWSAYKTLGDTYTNDQRDLGRYYRDYVRFMAAIDSASPGGILTVRYEDLVADVETETRRMLDFLGLDFDPSCIDFHLSEDAVATPSSEQVRRPMNREGIGSARPYRQWLGPLIEELGDLAD